MKRVKAMALLGGIFLGATVSAGQAWAAPSAAPAAYSERLVLAGEKDGILKVALEGEADEDGYVYVIRSVKAMTPTGEVSGENIGEKGMEEYSQGKLDFYRIKAADPSRPVVLNASFDCPGFYDIKKKAPDNGGESYPVAYKFTNYFPAEIGKYTLDISVPEKNEIINVTKPEAYADFNLSQEGKMRSVGVSKKLEPAGAVNLNFTYNVPAVSQMSGKLAVWAVCLSVGLMVLAVRLKEAGKENQ